MKDVLIDIRQISNKYQSFNNKDLVTVQELLDTIYLLEYENKQLKEERDNK